MSGTEEYSGPNKDGANKDYGGAMHEDHFLGIAAALIVALFAALTFLAKAWGSVRASVDTCQTLQATTRHIAHEVELLIEAHNDFQGKGWSTLPGDMNSSSGLTAVIRDIQHDLHSTKATQSDILRHLEKIQKTLDNHHYNY